MADTRKLMQLLLDPGTMELITLAVKEGLYPSQIAERTNKSKSLVTKKLNELESHGILKSHFVRKGSSVVKKFELKEEEITVNVNFPNGTVKVSERKRTKEKKTIKPSERVKDLLR